MPGYAMALPPVRNDALSYIAANSSPAPAPGNRTINID